MPETLGIDNLKKLVKIGCGFGKQTAAALEDGKFQWTDAFKFVELATQLPGAAKSLPEVKKELADLSPAERTELTEYLRTEFDIPNDRLEEMIENSLMFAVSAIGLFEQWKLLKK